MNDRTVKLERAKSAARAVDQAAPADPTFTVRNTALTLLLFLAVILVLQYLQAMVIPIVLGILMSYALEPIVAWMVRWKVPRAVASAVVLLSLVAGGGALIYSLRTQANAVLDQLPEAAVKLRRTLERDRPDTAVAIDQVQKAANELEKAAVAATGPPPTPAGVTRVQVESPRFNAGAYLMWGSLGVAALLGQLLLVLLLVFFLLASGDLYRRKLVKIAGPSLSQKRITVEILADVSRQIESFLAVQAFTSILVGVVSWLAFLWLGLEQAALWGLLAGVFNSIPYLGPVIVTGSIATAGFLQFGTLQMAFEVGFVSLVITSLEGFLLTPWLNSRAASMNAVAVFVGLIFWGALWDVWGMLLAVPIMMVIKSICDHVEDFKSVGEMLGD